MLLCVIVYLHVNSVQGVYFPGCNSELYYQLESYNVIFLLVDMHTFKIGREDDVIVLAIICSMCDFS